MNDIKQHKKGNRDSSLNQHVFSSDFVFRLLRVVALPYRGDQRLDKELIMIWNQWITRKITFTCVLFDADDVDKLLTTGFRTGTPSTNMN